MKLYTIGFTKSTAEDFFRRLESAEIRTVLDTRLHPDGQLSGFAKAVDLRFFLSRLTRASYAAEPLLMPSADILKAYQQKSLSWDEYSNRYKALLQQRHVASKLDVEKLSGACLLCSEHKPDRCHRRLAAEFLRDSLTTSTTIEIVHL